MMTAGTAINVEKPYYHLYPQTNFDTSSNERQSRIVKDTSSPEMAFCFASSAESEDEPMEIVHNHDRLSSNEEDKNSFNDLNSMKRRLINESFPFSLQHSAARGGFAINQRALEDFYKLSAQHKELQSPGTNEHNGTSPSLTQKNDQKRLSPQDKTRGNLSNQTRQQLFDDDDDDSWKVCGVCNDKATGYHFNALTCEGCKGFFRRSVKNGKSFTCSYRNQCSITKSNRRQCQACRLRKCIQIGMKRECIMSQDQIQQKKTLVLTNRIKRAAQQWTPTDPSEEQIKLLNVIRAAFKESNNPPDLKDVRGKEAVLTQNPHSPPNSPASSNSSTSHFIELIKQMSQEIAARTPSNMTNNIINAAHVLHFTDIMEFSIKEVIKFCKKIPTFMDVDLKDQISLLKAGCTEILFLKANYTYDIERKALTLGPDILYTRESFLQGGMSETYTDYYLKFHEDLGLLKLDDTEMSSLSAIALFSADRSDVHEHSCIETQQLAIACALQAYTETTYKSRNRFANIMAFLPRLRTLNVLCTHAFAEVQKTYGDEIKPLVMEIQPDDDEC